MLNHRLLTPARSGALVGLLTSSILGFVYIVILREPASAFYAFASLALLGGPLLAGLVAALRAQQRRIRSALAATGVVLVTVWLLFAAIYAFAIRLQTKRVEIPAFCDGTYAMAALPSDLAYELPDGTKSILILRDEQATVAATVDLTQPQRPVTLYLIDTATKALIGSIPFPYDIVAVAMDDTTVYFFHEGIGHSIRKTTGKYEPYYVTIDAYGLNVDGFFETSGVFSSWSADGTIKLRPYLTFSGIARGCHIAGDTQRITKL